jgi:hypothetical protein
VVLGTAVRAGGDDLDALDIGAHRLASLSHSISGVSAGSELMSSVMSQS